MKTLLLLLLIGNVVGDCFFDCNRDSGYKWLCNKPYGCDTCEYPEETCEKLCKRCAGREGNQYGGLDCQCPEPEPDCHPDCQAETGKFWQCDKHRGCTECAESKEELCERFCNRCEGRPDNKYAGLDCTCPGDTPAPVAVAPIMVPSAAPVDPTGPCWPTCGSDATTTWVCDKANACRGCKKADTCEMLCSRCASRQEYGGLDCDCEETPTAAPVKPICWPACKFDGGAPWVCNRSGFGCRGCDDTADVCEKLCKRCSFPSGENEVAEITCVCP